MCEKHLLVIPLISAPKNFSPSAVQNCCVQRYVNSDVFAKPALMGSFQCFKLKISFGVEAACGIQHIISIIKVRLVLLY